MKYLYNSLVLCLTKGTCESLFFCRSFVQLFSAVLGGGCEVRAQDPDVEMLNGIRSRMFSEAGIGDVAILNSIFDVFDVSFCIGTPGGRCDEVSHV